MTTTNVIRETAQDELKITDSVLRLVRSRLESMSRCSRYSKIAYLTERDAIFSQEDLIQEAMTTLVEAIKTRNLKFKGQYQVVQYAMTIFTNKLRYFTRQKTQIKKSNAFTVSLDAPKAENNSYSGNSNVVTVGDVTSTELKYQITEHCYDAIDLLRHNMYIKISKNLDISIISAGLLSKLNPTDTIMSMGTYLIDRMNMSRKEMAAHYATKNLYLGIKLYNKINDAIDNFTSRYFEGELCLN